MPQQGIYIPKLMLLVIIRCII